MKKQFFIVLSVCFLLMPATVAYADVILEPTDEFYMFNASECAYLDRDFYANGAGGGVSVKSEPGSAEEKAVIENNAEVYVYCTYTLAGNAWGLVQREEDKDSLAFSGWVPMDELLPVNSNPSTGAQLQEAFLLGSGLSTPVLAVILVASLAVGTVVLLRVFWKPKKGGA